MTTAKIAVGGFIHETNTFVSSQADLNAFRTGHGFAPMEFGDAIGPALKGINIGLAGFMRAAPADWSLRPLVWANAVPSGPVTREAFETITNAFLECIVQEDEIDAIYLDLHGAMVTEEFDDGEGEFLRRVRGVVGAEIPIVVSLDLHANVTPEMFLFATAMVSYRTYPHIDMAETGERCAALLGTLLETRSIPARAFRRLPFLIPTIAQCTDLEPCKTIYRRVAELEGGAVMSTSFNPGFPASDFPGCRPTVVTYAVNQASADAAADAIASLVVDHEADFNFPLVPALDAVRDAIRLGRPGAPVVIADTQDNPGAGAASDSTGLLRALIAAGTQNAAIGLIVDPDAARLAHRAGVGEEVWLHLGGHSGVAGDTPLEMRYRVEALSDGKIRMKGPLYGDSPADLGLSARLDNNGVKIVLASNPVQMADLEMFRFIGIEPSEMAILVVKSSVHFRAAFDPIASRIIVAEAPGAMIADPSRLPWKHLAPDVRTRPLRSHQTVI